MKSGKRLSFKNQKQLWEDTFCGNKMYGKDSRRIQGPAESIPISSFIKKANNDCSMEKLLDSKGSRNDGRKWDEFRPLFVRTGIVEKAKGSCYYETHDSKVVCSVYGPRESKRKTEFSSKGKLVCDVTFAPFSQQTRQPSVQEAKTKNISSLVETALKCAVCLDSFPKSQLDIYIKVLQDSGDVLTPAIISASIAIADAGIEMYDVVSACSVAFDNKNIIVDPSSDELNSGQPIGNLTIGYLPSLNLVSCMVQKGKIDSERNPAAVKACIEGCLRIHTSMQECIVNGVERKKQFLVNEQKYS